MTTRAIQIESLLTPVIDDATGSICGAGYNVYFYAAGTSTPKNIWTEKEKTNPFTSRAMGADGTVQVYGDGIYKIVIKDADASTVHEWDDVKIQANHYIISAKAGAYTAVPDDDMLIVDTDGGDVTIQAETVDNFEHPLTIFNSGSNSVIFDPDSAELVDGESTFTIPTGANAVTFIPDTNASTWRLGVAVTLMQDLDADTRIQVEESSDEDIIRFDVAGREILTIGGPLSEPTTLSEVRFNSLNNTDSVPYGGFMSLKWYSDNKALSGATETIFSVPANCIVLGVTARITEAAVGCTTITIGASDGNSDLYVSGMSPSLNATAGPADAADPTLLPWYTTAASVVVVYPVGGAASFSDGTIRVDVYYLQLTPPTS